MQPYKRQLILYEFATVWHNSQINYSTFQPLELTPS